MSRFNPTTRIVLPDNEPDLLAGAVLDSLIRPTHRELSWTIGRSILFTIFTLGIVPLMAAMRQLHRMIAHQSQQFWHLAEWLRLHVADPDVQQLQQSTQSIRFNMPLAIVQSVFLLSAAGAVAMHFASATFSVRELFRFAYHIPVTVEAVLFTFALSAAAMCHWAHLAWHQQNVERYIRWFNQLAMRWNAEQVPLPAMELGLRPMWVAAGIALAATGALWALPVMLAVGSHRRYTKVTSRQMRHELADRLRTILLAQRPAKRLPPPVAAMWNCLRPDCRAALPPAANFCPRCGTRVAKTANVVA